MKEPEVSIVMPAFNSERYIAEAVSSVIKQTYTDWELIIIDDGSTDRTFEFARRFSERDDRIHLLRNETNLGVAKSRNRAFQYCKGKYIALLDSDDLWEPDKIEKQVQCARSSHAEIVCCSYSIIDDEGRIKCPDFLVPEDITFESMLKRSTISCSTALLRHEVVEKYQFPTDMYHEDLAFWLLLLKEGVQAVGITEVLASYRVAQGSRAFNKLKSAYNRWKIYREYLGISAPRSALLLLQYMYFGLVKYRRKLRREEERRDRCCQRC